MENICFADGNMGEIWGKWGTQTSDYLNYKTITVLSLNENWPCALCVNMFGIDSIHLDK